MTWQDWMLIAIGSVVGLRLGAWMFLAISLWVLAKGSTPSVRRLHRQCLRRIKQLDREQRRREELRRHIG